MTSLVELDSRRSRPGVTFHPGPFKRLTTSGLCRRKRADAPYLMMARYYSSGLGRFMEVDPSSASTKATNPQTWNRYTYSLDNPIKYFDPNGRDVRLSTEGNSGAVREMLVQGVMRPSSRTELQSLASNHDITVTYKDAQLNTLTQIQQLQGSGKGVTDGSTHLDSEVKSATTGKEHLNIEAKIDTAAVQFLNPDPSGASTVCHEGVHAEAIAGGADDPNTSEPQAQVCNEQVGSEKADLLREDAERMVDEMLGQKGNK